MRSGEAHAGLASEPSSSEQSPHVTDVMITIIGGGLAGCEAAWQAASRGVPVTLSRDAAGPCDRRAQDRSASPSSSAATPSAATSWTTPSASSRRRCGGSARSSCAAAEAARVPAGAALAVDRERFARGDHRGASARIRCITVVREEVTAIPRRLERRAGHHRDRAADVRRAVGRHRAPGRRGAPLLLRRDQPDRAAPRPSTDRRCSARRGGAGVCGAGHASAADPASSRRHRAGADDGEGDYLNCPLDSGGVRALPRGARSAPSRAPSTTFDEETFFEGCLPIEVMARRGVDTLRFGPMKPVGLVDPRTGRQPYAVVQLRQDNLAGDHFSLVGFQTQLKWGEQARVLRLIPGPRARRVRALRHGAPQHVHQRPDRARARPGRCGAARHLFFAGQISGVEGYVESAASGLLAGLQRGGALRSAGRFVSPPRTTAIGALAYYVSHAEPARLSADQHHLRHHGAARPAPPRGRLARAQALASARPGGSGRLDRAGRSRGSRRAARASRRAARRGPGRQGLDDRDTLRAFLEYLRAQPRTRRRTRSRAYESDLSQFLAFLAARPGRSPRTGSSRPTSTWRDPGLPRRSSTGGGNSRASAARKLAAIRSFGRYLRREALIEGDPAALVATPKRGETIPAHLAERRDDAAARDAGRVDPARPPRSGDPGAVLRVRAAAERARRPGSGGRESRRPDGARPGQGRQGADRAVQHQRGAGAAGVPGRSRRVRGAGRARRARPGSARARQAGAISAARRARDPRQPLFVNYRGAGCRPAASTGWCGATSRRAGTSSASARTRCATRSRPICWSAGPICARSRNCSGTCASARRSATRTSTPRSCWRCTSDRTPAPERKRGAGGAPSPDCRAGVGAPSLDTHRDAY